MASIANNLARVRERMAAAARRRAVEEFDAERIIPMYEDYYTEVIEKSALPV